FPVAHDRRRPANPEVARFRPEGRLIVALSGQPAPQQFAHRRRPAGHPLLESEVVEYDQFIRRQHELQPFATHEARHFSLLCFALLTLSKSFTPSTPFLSFKYFKLLTQFPQRDFVPASAHCQPNQPLAQCKSLILNKEFRFWACQKSWFVSKMAA